ncbi:ATP-binding protein [Plantactinospora sp. BB1]|uniref:ATP-binding protein n=1 Tax=Plantactinospora sp. BB1 TaxID=2071627 RepID=UPI000D17BC8C|nr:ATP-binding protein [Plantactinospora sp. BB1]AVT40285.1 hypothetical protein C6W10_31835 [Plantactinospora sp. BB1]
MLLSPRSGGEADKFGNRYEGAWTVRHLLYVLAGRAKSVTVEDFGDLALGVEFTYWRGDVVQVHQLKRQNYNANSWTVKSLQDKGIWANVRHHVDGGRQFHFISIVPAVALKSLANRARRAESAAQFVGDWLTNKDLRDAFDDLCSPDIFGDTEVAWRLLRGFWIDWPSEDDIIEVNATLAELQLDGAVGTLAAVGLGDLVVNNLGVGLDAGKIEADLSRYGLRRSDVQRGKAIVEQAESLNAGWVASIERELLQPTIPRTEATQLVDSFSGTDRLFLLTGSAGGGKTAALHQVFQSLNEAGTPVLGFRLDRLDPFSTTTELGRRVGLDVSPVTALAAAAGERECVLIIDQLDAVSLVSGRMPTNYDAIANLVREAYAFPEMRVVLACRKFDVDNDYRIRELVSEKRAARIHVGDLSETQVAEAVQAMGLDASALNTQQKKLLTSPLNLVLLRHIADEVNALSFQTTNHLLDAFWQRKLIHCTQRRASVRFNDVVSTLAVAISARQRLSVPITVLDDSDLSVDAGVLVSEHVLVRDGQQIAFFHEAFFDYAFARGWTGRNQTLVEFLEGGEQELFRRAQVRQIVNYLRELEPDRFVAEVEALITSPVVRYHIKDVALTIIGALDNPTADEWAMVSNVMETHPPFENRLWRSLGQVGWFERLDAEGMIEEWLGSADQADQAHALDVMAAAAKRYPDRLAQILRPHVTKAEYPSWLQWVIRFADLHESRAIFDLVKEAVRDGKLDGAEREVWLAADDLGGHQPAWAVELLAAYLVDRPGAMALNNECKVVALLDRDHSAVKLVTLAATGAPQLFCELIVPYILRVTALTAYEDQEKLPLRDRHFSFRFPDNDPHDLEEAVLAGATTAIRLQVERDPVAARPTLELLAADPHETAQWLLYGGLKTAGEPFAQWAVELLLQGSHRFLSGYTSNGVWSARQVIQATNSFVAEEFFRHLENAILSLRFPWETGSPGWYMFNLLSAMDEARLSEVGRRRLGELRRRMNADQPPEPEGVTGGSVGPPIPRDAAEKMNDEQWLRAMAKHNTEKTDWQTFTGGVQEQAGVLQEQTAADPERFARLALRFTPETPPAYGSAVLLGLAQAEALSDPAPAFEAVRHIASLGQPVNDRWVGWALRKYLKLAPQDLVEIVLHRAVNASDPTDGRLKVWQTNREHTGGQDLYSSGTNSARGSNAEVLGDLLVHDADGSRTALVLPVLDRLASDQAITVRSCVAHLIHASMRHARPEALHAFALLLDADDMLLATDNVGRLITYLGYENPEVAIPVIERMVGSPIYETRQVGGQLAALAAMQWQVSGLLDQVVATDDVPLRAGAAATCALSLPNTGNVEVTRRALEQFMEDSQEEVRKAVAKVAGALRAQRLRSFKGILTSLIASAAFADALPQLLITLERAPDRVDDLVLKCCNRFVEVLGTDAGDIRTGAAGDARRVGKLLVRAYTQAPSKEGRSRALDLLDRLLAIGAYGVADVIRESER